MAEESVAEADGVQKRKRRTKAEMQEGLPPFDPSLVEGRVHVTAKRVIRTGQYESFDVMVHLEFERDPRFSVLENVNMLNSLAVQEVNRAADLVQSQIAVEK
jgi:hypothetical protein